MPWHVCKSANFIIDISTLGGRNDVTVDAWQWKATKVYVTSSPDPSNEKFTKGKVNDHTRAVRR